MNRFSTIKSICRVGGSVLAMLVVGTVAFFGTSRTLRSVFVTQRESDPLVSDSDIDQIKVPVSPDHAAARIGEPKTFPFEEAVSSSSHKEFDLTPLGGVLESAPSAAVQSDKPAASAANDRLAELGFTVVTPAPQSLAVNGGVDNSSGGNSPVTVSVIRAYAEKGDAQAQAALGWSYDSGDGVAKNAVEAVKWYRKAAEQGHVLAQYNLGNCYFDGQGVTKDEVEAVKWYRKAAEQGQVLAQYNLGVCYEHGSGVAKDTVEALMWYGKAATQGLASAKSALAGFSRNPSNIRIPENPSRPPDRSASLSALMPGQPLQRRLGLSSLRNDDADSRAAEALEDIAEELRQKRIDDSMAQSTKQLNDLMMRHRVEWAQWDQQRALDDIGWELRKIGQQQSWDSFNYRYLPPLYTYPAVQPIDRTPSLILLPP